VFAVCAGVATVEVAQAPFFRYKTGRSPRITCAGSY
jgi:hypothetical protein